MRFSLPSRSPQFQVAGVGGAATPGIWNEAFTDAMGGAGSPFESRDRPKCRPPFVPGLATGEMRLANGVAHTENLKLDLDNATVSMAGLMNLVDQSARGPAQLGQARSKHPLPDGQGSLI